MNLSLARDLAAQLTVALQDDPIPAPLPAPKVVQAGESIQTYLAAASPGDIIELLPGVRYVGKLTFPVPVTLRTQGVLPELRVSPNDASALATIASGALEETINLTGRSDVTIDGVQLESRSDGLGEVVVMSNSNNIVLDRILLVAGPNGQKRGIRGNGTNITLRRSHIANIWASGQDSQAFCAWDGAGPYTIVDNFLEAASENIMFGGADSLSADRVPSDILVESNLLSKPLAWKGTGKAVKNLFELKSARRVIVRGNVFDTVYTDAQTGYAILFKSVNQGGTAPWSATEDVLFENNIIRNAENGFSIQGETFEMNSNGTTQHGGRTTGIVIRRNNVQVAGVAVQISGAPGAITLDRTTFVNGYTFMQLDGNPMESLTITNVLANHNAYGVKGSSTGIGTPSLTKFALTYAWADNVLLGGPGGGTYPPTTYYDLASVPAGVVVGR